MPVCTIELKLETLTAKLVGGIFEELSEKNIWNCNFIRQNKKGWKKKERDIWNRRTAFGIFLLENL